LAANVAGYVLPKVNEVADVQALDSLLATHEAAAGVAVGSTEIVPLIETAAGIYHSYDIAKASTRIVRIGGGFNASPGGDAAHSLGITVGQDGAGMEPFAAFTVLSARAAGIEQIIGGMSTNFRDLDLVRQVAVASRRMGSTGTFAIHPTQVPIYNEVHTPTDAEIAEAIKVVDLMRASADGAIAHGDVMLDAAHVRSSERVIRRARQLGLVVP
jgi:citrate lyase subunit beta/citryl-CoA lyase